jgi:class 3 adenylate cyclase/tetratricopeptide (TPR) repeat protein
MTRLRQWLDDLGLGQYAELFEEKHIDQETLPKIADRDLEDLGIPLEHRKRLIDAIAGRGERQPQNSQHGPEVPSLAGAVSGRRERRHLTVLFCDIVGSTALSTRVDPEDLQTVLYQFETCCNDAIRHYSGHIFRLIGDGVLAYFGFPTAHEDDAERAVNAALKIQQSIGLVATDQIPKIEVRIGLATGLVLVGDLSGEQRDLGLVGEAPNLASRLQQLAGPNQILLAASTRRLLGRLFDFEDFGEHRVKGIDAPVGVWRVLGKRSFASRFEARRTSQLTPLVGRKSELDKLHAAYEEAKRGAGRVVLISGEPGVGKSRLMMALSHHLVWEGCLSIFIQCSAYHASSALYPIIRYLENAAGIARDNSSTVKFDKLEAFVGRYAKNRVQSIAPLLAALVGIPFNGRHPPLELAPQQQKNRTFAALLDLFDAQTKVQPVLFVVEDVHWIDPTTLELLEQIRDRVHGWPSLVIILFRPEFSLDWADQPYVSSMKINRLDSAQVAAMIELVAGEYVLSPKVRAEIAAKTDGVPLFVEEITKAVVASGKQSETRAEWETTLNVPDTLHESLMARLDKVASMKRVAQAAAVIGREFSLQLLETIVPFSKDQVRAAIDRLLEVGVVFHRDDADNDVYVFNHVLVQDEAYASLLREERRTLHLKIAEVLCSKFAGTAESEPEIVARHYTKASKREAAIDYWLKAGHRASERSAFAEAITHVETALKLLGDLPATTERNKLELPLQQLLASALIATRGFGSDEVGKAFRRALELCDTFDESPQTFAALTGIVGVNLQRANFGQAGKLAQDLLNRADRQDDSTARMMGHHALGMCLMFTGEFTRARNHLRETLELYDLKRHGPLAVVFARDFKATAQAHLALVSVILGDLHEGVAIGQAAVEHAERLRHPHSLGYVMPFLSGAYLMCGDPKAAHPIAERTMALASEHGFPLWLAGGRLMRGWAQLDLGDATQGLLDIRQSVDELTAIGTLLWVQFGRYLLAQAMAKTHDGQGALALIDIALAEIGASGGCWYAADLHRLKGDVLLEFGKTSESEACFKAAIAVAERQQARLWQLQAINHLTSSCRDRGKIAEFRARLEPLYATFAKEPRYPVLRQAETLLAQTVSALALSGSTRMV